MAANVPKNSVLVTHLHFDSLFITSIFEKLSKNCNQKKKGKLLFQSGLQRSVPLHSQRYVLISKALELQLGVI